MNQRRFNRIKNMMRAAKELESFTKRELAAKCGEKENGWLFGHVFRELRKSGAIRELGWIGAGRHRLKNYCWRDRKDRYYEVTFEDVSLDAALELETP